MGAVRDQNDRNNWKWLNGDDVTVSFWNLPGGNEDCARYDGSKGWLWSDTNCLTNLNFICQHRKFFYFFFNTCTRCLYRSSDCFHDTCIIILSKVMMTFYTACIFQIANLVVTVILK